MISACQMMEIDLLALYWGVIGPREENLWNNGPDENCQQQYQLWTPQNINPTKKLRKNSVKTGRKLISLMVFSLKARASPY